MKNICHSWHNRFRSLNDNVPTQILHLSKCSQRYLKLQKFVVGSIGIHPRQTPFETEDERQTLMLQSENRITRGNNVIMDKQLSKHFRRTARQ